MRGKLLVLALFGLGILAPGVARADNAYVLTQGSLRAGPGTDYPPLVVLAPGHGLDVYGCLQGWNWCDVSWQGYRGWMRADHIGYGYGGQWVPIPSYGERIGVPVITFDFGYWDRHYRDRDFYRERDVWFRRHPEYRHVHDRDDWRDRDWRREHERDEWRREHDRDAWRREHDRDAWRGQHEHDDRDSWRGNREQPRSYNLDMIREKAARDQQRSQRVERYRRIEAERAQERAARSVAPMPRRVDPGGDGNYHGHGGGNPDWAARREQARRNVQPQRQQVPPQNTDDPKGKHRHHD